MAANIGRDYITPIFLRKKDLRSDKRTPVEQAETLNPGQYALAQRVTLGLGIDKQTHRRLYLYPALQIR